jgi:hypothetical protein
MAAMTIPRAATFSVNAPAVACQIMDGEAILIHFDRGDYFSVTGSGAFLLELLERGLPSAQLTHELSWSFELELERAQQVVNEFLAQLLDEALVVANVDAPSAPITPAIAVASAAGSNGALGARSPFEPPRLVKYSDLQDLLVLDPIHDVVLGGWPSGTH